MKCYVWSAAAGFMYISHYNVIYSHMFPIGLLFLPILIHVLRWLSNARHHIDLCEGDFYM